MIDCAARGRQCRSVDGRRPFVALRAPHIASTRGGGAALHLPMQKRPKISPSRSSALNCAGDLAERVVRQAQFLGEQIERGVACVGVRLARSRCARVRRKASTWRARAMKTPRARPASRRARAARARSASRPAPVAADRRERRRSTRGRAARSVELVEDVQQPAVGRRRAGSRPRSRASAGVVAGLADAGSGRAGTPPRRRARSRPSCARCRCARPRRSRLAQAGGVDHVHRHAFDLDRLRRPCRAWCPAIGVTIASSAPASALSSELLPTLGWPASTTLMPSRSSAPWRARASTASSCAAASREPAARVGALEEIDLLVGKVERRLDQHAQLDQRVGERVDLARERAVERARRPSAPRLRCWRRSGRRRPRPAPGRACR